MFLSTRFNGLAFLLTTCVVPQDVPQPTSRHPLRELEGKLDSILTSTTKGSTQRKEQLDAVSASALELIRTVSDLDTVAAAAILGVGACEARAEGTVGPDWSTIVRAAIEKTAETAHSEPIMRRLLSSCRIRDLRVLDELAYFSSDDSKLTRSVRGMATLGCARWYLEGDRSGTVLSEKDVASCLSFLMTLESDYSDVPSPQQDSHIQTMQHWAKWCRAELTSFRLGADFPKLETHDVDGREVTSQTLEGKVTIVDVMGFTGSRESDLGLVKLRASLLHEFPGETPLLIAVVSNEGSGEYGKELFARMRELGWSHVIRGRGLNTDGSTVSSVMNVPPSCRVIVLDAHHVVRWKSTSPETYFGNEALLSAVKSVASRH